MMGACRALIASQLLHAFCCHFDLPLRLWLTFSFLLQTTVTRIATEWVAYWPQVGSAGDINLQFSLKYIFAILFAKN